MVDFKEFLVQEETVARIINLFEVTMPSQQVASATTKPWSAKKAEIMQIWGNLRPDTPIYITPMKEPVQGGHSHSYGEDGIRITGSWQFIASIMARIKELLSYENPKTKLRLVFKGVDSNRVNEPNKQAFAFYVNLQPRGRRKRGPKQFGNQL